LNGTLPGRIIRASANGEIAIWCMPVQSFCSQDGVLLIVASPVNS
jgi:hypothetical protein